MFEDSLITSGVSTDQRRNAGRTRWIALTSVAIQGAVLTAFIVVPLIWPETLPLVSITPKMTSLTMKKPEVKIQPKPIPVVATNDNSYQPPSQPQMMEARSGGIIQHSSSNVLAEAAPEVGIGIGMGSRSVFGPGGDGIGTAPTPVVVKAAPKSTTPLAVSSGVSRGMLIAPIQPVYPRIAIQAHVEGTVVVTAIIDKHGRITGLQVVSGPEMLKAAAADAIREARYHPYLLNGEPTDVVTTISVNFRMGS
jgi:protein TonB